MDEIFKAYLAALIDGEGVITVQKQSRGDNLPSYRPLVLVTNSHGALVEFLRETTGRGSVYHGKQDKKRPRWSPMSRWAAASMDARDIAGFVYPYLVLKRRQAEIVRDFPSRPVGRRARGQKDSIYARQVELYLKAKELNKRGSGSHKIETFPADHPFLNRRPKL